MPIAGSCLNFTQVIIQLISILHIFWCGFRTFFASIIVDARPGMNIHQKEASGKPLAEG
jgi:hypothetical protein